IVYQLTEPEISSKEAQKRNSTENGIVPKFPSNSTEIPSKESLNSLETVPKTVHGTVKNHQMNRQGTVSTRACRLPADFGISDRVARWAEERGHESLEAHLEYFVGYAKASGKKYVDWDEAFMNAIRGNW